MGNAEKLGFAGGVLLSSLLLAIRLAKAKEGEEGEEVLDWVVSWNGTGIDPKKVLRISAGQHPVSIFLRIRSLEVVPFYYDIGAWASPNGDQVHATKLINPGEVTEFGTSKVWVFVPSLNSFSSSLTKWKPGEWGAEPFALWEVPLEVV